MPDITLAPQGLRGLSIMVTRPAHQAATFCAMLQNAGAQPLLCPAMRICEPADRSSLLKATEQLDDYDILMFNSPNAAERGIEFIHRARRLPQRALLAAIGSKTAQAIEQYGYRVAAYPSAGFDSESFLALPEVADVRGKRVAIFRGQSGRMLLAETLRQRGAEVEFITTYERHGPDSQQAAKIRETLLRGVHAVTVTSSEMLRSLVACLDPPALEALKRSTLITGHPRISAKAQQLQLPMPLTAADPSDESMFSALLKWAAER